MIGTLRKHSNWLWIFIIAATVVSFVIYFTPGVGRQARGIGDADDLGTINGQPVSREDYDHARRDTYLRFLFSFGQFPASESEARAKGVNLSQEIIQRLMLGQRAQELNVQVSDKALAAFISGSPAFRDRDSGAFRKEYYESFVKRTLADGRLGEEDFLHYARSEIGIQRLVEIFGQSAKLVTPAEAEELYRQENEQFLTEVVAFSPQDFVGQVQASSTNLSQFYSNRLAIYRLPDRLVVNFVKFDFTNFVAEGDAELAKLTNINARIDAVYNARGPAAYMDTNNQPMMPDKAKEKIKADFREEMSTLAARKAAIAFATELDAMEPKKAANLLELAKKKNLMVEESLPFSEFEPPVGLKVMESFVKQAFSTTAEEPFRGPIQGVDAFYVIAQKKKLPSEIPPMESVLQKVMDDYRAEQSMQLARSAGEGFAAKVKAGLAEKKDFETICAQAKINARSVPAFSLSTRQVEGLDRTVSLFDLQSSVHSLAPGQASGFGPTREGGFVVYLKSRLPANEEKMKEELPQFMTEVRRARQNQAFQEWFRKSMENARVTGRLASTATGS